MASNWGVAAGLGQGIMQGLNFNRQLNADARADQALENQNEIVRMQKDLHGEKMGALNRENAERQRTETLGNLKTGIESNYQDLPDYKRQQMFVDYGLQTGLMKPADLDAATKVRDSLIQTAGPEAYQAVLRGDIKPMQQLLSTKGYDIQPDAKAGSYIIRMPNSDSVQSIDKNGLLQLDAMATYRDQLANREQAALKSKKMEAEIRNIDSRTELNGRLPQDKFSLSAREGGSGGKGGKAEKAYDPISTLEDFNKAVGNDPATNQPYSWGPSALQHYQQIVDANPDFANSKQGGQYALNMAIALGKGQAKAVPEIDANGNTQLVASWPGANGKSPRKVVLQNGIDMADPEMVQGNDGKPILQAKEWQQVQANAVQTYAKSRPDEYRLVAPIAADPEKLARLAAAAESSPDAKRQYNFARLIRDQIAQQSAAPTPSGKAVKELTDADRKVASALGYDPEAPGIIDAVSSKANRFIDRAKGLISSANGDQFESAIRIAQRTPGMPGIRQKLFEMARGNPERQARLMEVFGKEAQQ